MSQTFQLHYFDFNILTERILGFKNSSFKDENTVRKTIENCVLFLKIDKVLEIGDISFSGGSIGENSFVHFTLIKKENVDQMDFLKALKVFNVG
ncbi:hypothetical protein [Flavobacterium limi]|uniref:Uncharacterized protein n=1 Tax=Flavobacterium limi TaxID=2045105 RepID=A0ABQ1TN32_9FLAO|nr:hypothetical protein [Flavobacterium limi]GGE98896.1 hypothetical protein GCM10011518_05380 [Flavobacterium limi]